MERKILGINASVVLTAASGRVMLVLADGEVERIAEFLEMPLYQFVKDFTRLRDNRQGLSLVDKEGTSECIMLNGVDCRLQAVKPFQCTGFPNRWNFENWREACEAIPAPRPVVS